MAIEAGAEQIAQDMTARDGQVAARGAHGGDACATILAPPRARPARRSARCTTLGAEPVAALDAPPAPRRRRADHAAGTSPTAIPVWSSLRRLIHGNTEVLKLGYEAPRTGLDARGKRSPRPAACGASRSHRRSLRSAPSSPTSDVRAISFTGSVPGGTRGTRRGHRRATAASSSSSVVNSRSS